MSCPAICFQVASARDTMPVSLSRDLSTDAEIEFRIFSFFSSGLNFDRKRHTVLLQQYLSGVKALFIQVYVENLIHFNIRFTLTNT